MTGANTQLSQVVSKKISPSMNLKSFKVNSLNGLPRALLLQKLMSMTVSIQVLTYATLTGFTPDSAQTDEYLKRADALLKGRMMYASNRLYATIVDIYGEDDIQEGAEVFSEIFTAFL